MVRDSRGRFFALSQSRPSEILFFDSAGRFLKPIGREGSGPGEFRFVGGILALPGDSLLVVDASLKRITVLTAEQRLSRTVSMPVGSFKWDGVLLDDGGVVLNMFVGSPSAAGSPLHLVDRQGNITLSFGSTDDEVIRADLRSSTYRKLARARGRGVWSARINQYKIELWNKNGDKVRELVGNPSWFKSWWVETDLSPENPPQTKLVSIHEDRQGLLWIMFNVPDPRWRQGLEVARTPEGQYHVPIEKDLVYDTIIEVLDGAGTLLASQRLPVALVKFVDDGLAFSLRESLGDSQILIWNLSLFQPH